jgi:acetyl esterase/lipase
LPEHAAAAPVLFMVHGGAWMVGDKATSRVVTNKMNRWVPKGFILVSVNYRMLPKADPLEQANDVAKALAFAQSKAKSWGGDPARFVLMGHSAGAHLVALLAADPGIATRQGAKPWRGTVALDSAAFDVPRIMEARHPRFYDRVFKTDPEYWRKASPIYRLSSAGAPMMLVCSSLRQDSCPQAQSFAAKATAKGGRVSVLPIALSHGEINQNLGLAGEYTKAVESFLRSIGVNSGSE